MLTKRRWASSGAGCLDTASAPGNWGDAFEPNDMLSWSRSGPVSGFVVGDLQVDGENTYRDVVQWTFYTDKGDRVWLEYAPYGILRRIVRQEQVNLTKGAAPNRKKVLVEGYIDGPLPIPQQNVALDPQAAQASVTYGEESELLVEETLVQELKFGVRSEGSLAPEVGVGVAWDIAVSLGSGSELTERTTQTLSEAVTQNLVLKDKVVQPVGTVVVHDITLMADGFEFVPHGQDKPVKNAPAMSLVYLDRSGASKRSYTVTTTQPGDLKTYTKAHWTAKMKEVYPNLKDYIDEIIEPRALRFGGDRKSLHGAWSVGSPAETRFFSTAEQFESSKITLEMSMFSGPSAKFLGAEAKLMVGFESSVEATEASAESYGFGVELKVECAGPAPHETGIKDFAFNTYFLPADELWLNELRHFMTKDPELCDQLPKGPGNDCWKIMSVVDDLRINDDIEALEEFGMSRERRDELYADGIRTTDLLLCQIGLHSWADLVGSAEQVREPFRDLVDALRKWDEDRNVHDWRRSGTV